MLVKTRVANNVTSRATFDASRVHARAHAERRFRLAPRAAALGVTFERPGEEFFAPRPGARFAILMSSHVSSINRAPACVRGSCGVNAQVLIDAIVRQTMVLIAQLS